MEHIWSGPVGKRVITPNVVVEFSSRTVREDVLQKLNRENSLMTSGGKITCNRAKTAIQLKRNACLMKACNLLKKDNRCKNKSVNIVWQKQDGTKDRAVEVDGIPIFNQSISDLTGAFVDIQFQNLSF